MCVWTRTRHEDTVVDGPDEPGLDDVPSGQDISNQVEAAYEEIVALHKMSEQRVDAGSKALRRTLARAGSFHAGTHSRTVQTQYPLSTNMSHPNTLGRRQVPMWMRSTRRAQTCATTSCW